MSEEVQHAVERCDADDEIVAALVTRGVSEEEARAILQREKAELDLADVDPLDDTFDEPF